MTISHSGIRRLAFGLALAFLAAGCATTVQVNARFPAHNVPASELRKIAITEFTGPGGNEFANALQAELASAHFDGAPYFTVLGSGRPGIYDARAAASYGRSVSAQGVYFGRVEYASMHNESYEGQALACVLEDGNGNCKKWGMVNVPCVKRTFDISVVPTLVSVSSGNVIYSVPKSATTNTSWCRGSTQDVSDFALVDGARRFILSQIRNDVAPYNAVLRATIKESSDGLQGETAKTFESAVASAKKNDMGEACRLWQQVDKSSANHAWTVYDLGVCAEANGDYDTALSLYQRSRTLASKQDRDIEVSLGRINQLLTAKAELNRQQGERERRADAERKRQAEIARVKQEEDRKTKADIAAKHQRLTASFGAKFAAAIENRQAVIGMPMSAVVEALGQPSRQEKVPPNSALWHYPSQEIGFTAGKVTSVSH